MLAGFNWQRQLLILLFAGAMSLYWTSKQGLWAAISGTTQFDKDWELANMSLRKKLGLKYEIMEATNQREDKRTLILSPRQPASPQTIVAELFPIRPRISPHNAHKARGRFGERPKKKSAKELQQEKEEKRKKQRMGKGRRGKMMEPKEAVGRLRIYDDKLNFLKDAFMEDGVKRPESLIEVGDPAEKEAEEEPAQQPRGAIPQHPLPRGPPQAPPQQRTRAHPNAHPQAQPPPQQHAPPHANAQPQAHPQAHPHAAQQTTGSPEGAPEMHTETEL